ncbi:FAD-dependent oxidoreductase [Geothrix terrae]|uniref:FAD-dependent oxidoreductase n=1 Tax=Geothrix terrae TaxID=2922720 RepID=UPI001FAC730B|nr:FAD-dependent oxidoreductase [Geothrix terrae]
MTPSARHPLLMRWATGLLVALTLACHQPTQAPPPPENLYASVPASAPDLVVYGGTPAGISAAVTARRMGASVLLIEPHRWVGGMMTNGLGNTDASGVSVIGGVAREFLQRMLAYYQSPDAWPLQAPTTFRSGAWGVDGTMRYFEPHAARAIFEKMLLEAGVEVALQERLDDTAPAPVLMESGVIKSIRLVSGRVVTGRVFLDCSYEGDLMAAAGIHHVTGREGNATYGETLNGLQLNPSALHQFPTGIDPYVIQGDASSGLLPGLRLLADATNGQADPGTQAYTYRLCLTTLASNRRPITKPADYDERNYELLFRLYAAAPTTPLAFGRDPIPNLKVDSNSGVAFSTDHVGANHAYPEATWADRQLILAAHRSYQEGLLWTLANHPRIPLSIRTQAATWGLAADEFPETGGWPDQLYVREARRMVGEAVMTEAHAFGRVQVSDPIACMAYPIDSHHVQRVVTPQGWVQNEGGVLAQIPGGFSVGYAALTPSRKECRNLLVPVCLSATHVAFGAIRMEPHFMMLGQSAAAAAVLAARSGSSVQIVSYPVLKGVLLSQGQVL